MLHIKNTETEMKNTFVGHISILEWPKKKISEFENRSVETYQTDMQRVKTMKTYWVGQKVRSFLSVRWL